MPANIKLIFPTTVNRNNPCHSDQYIRHEQFILDTTSSPTGYAGSGIITVRNIDYEVTVALNVAGDQISGNASFYHRTKRATIDNVLIGQKTSFPSIPVFNEWAGLRLTGFGDTGILELSDKDTASVASPANTNDAIKATFEITIFKSYDYFVVSNDSQQTALTGSDADYWSQSNQSTITAQIVDVSLAATVQVQLSDLKLVVRPGTAQISGTIITTVMIAGAGEGEPSTVYTRVESFTSPLTASQYNSIFPWSNQWLLIDNLNPTMSLLDPHVMLPDSITADYHVVVAINIVGSKV